MRYYDWSEEKNDLLKKTRGLTFEMVVSLIEEGSIIDIIENPKKGRYPKQKMFILLYGDEVLVVPFVEDKEKIFLKTIYPDRKYRKLYLNQ